MRKYGRVDDNQPETIQALRDSGHSVQSLASVGDGCPDLLVGRSGVTTVMEIKDGSKPPSARKLTLEEKLWHEEWKGSVCVVESAEEAIEVMNRLVRRDRGYG